MKRCVGLALILGVLLTGCSLAVEGKSDDGMFGTNKLAGVVVTTEHLDLFDFESYLQDHPEDLWDGVIDGNGYEQRLYAQEVVESGTTEDGNPCTTTYYNFDHVKGAIALLNYGTTTRLADGSVLSYTYTGDFSQGFWDVTMGNAYTEGTIYLPSGTAGVVFYVNPVFQDEDGKLYLIPGTGISSETEVEQMWKNVKESYTSNLDGEEVTETREIKVIIQWTPVADEIRIMQMDVNHQILSEQTYTPDTLPETITPDDECAYVLVELLEDGNLQRILCQPGDRDFTVFRKTDAPYCTGVIVQVDWPET